jgi:PKD repeat protein
MRSVRVRIRAAEFSATMTAIGKWLDANRCEPTRYKYHRNEDAVLVTVDFPTGSACNNIKSSKYNYRKVSQDPAAMISSSVTVDTLYWRVMA